MGSPVVALVVVLGERVVVVLGVVWLVEQLGVELELVVVVGELL